MLHVLTESITATEIMLTELMMKVLRTNLIKLEQLSSQSWRNTVTSGSSTKRIGAWPVGGDREEWAIAGCVPCCI